MLKLRTIGLIAALVGLLATPAVLAVESIDLDLPCIAELTCDQTATVNDIDTALAVPEVGWTVIVSDVEPGTVARAYDLYRSYRVPWPRSQ